MRKKSEKILSIEDGAVFAGPLPLNAVLPTAQPGRRRENHLPAPGHLELALATDDSHGWQWARAESCSTVEPTRFEPLSPLRGDSSAKMSWAQVSGAQQRTADVTIIFTIYIQMFIEKKKVRFQIHQ